jgi:imidazolonepropionase-like amidohydrolase
MRNDSRHSHAGVTGRSVRGIVAIIALCLPMLAAARHVALVGGTLIDGNGGPPLKNAVLVMEGERITAVGPRGRIEVPADAEVFDVSGQYLLPGLMDANVHLFPWPSWTYIEFLARYEDNFEGIIAEGAQIALKSGVTSLFDSMGPMRSLMNVRDSIKAGDMVGPRLFVAGNIVGFRAVFTTTEAMAAASKAFQARINARFELNMGPDLVYLTPDEIYREMRSFIDLGADFIKYGATGDGDPVNSEIGQNAVLRFSENQQRAMVRAANDAGVPIQAHQTTAESLRIVVEVGNDMTQHCAHTGPTRILDETIAAMLERGFYCGTQWGALNEDELEMIRSGDFDPGDGVPPRYDLENAVRMIKAGVPQLMSTDAGTIDPDVERDWGPGGEGGLGGGSALIGEAHITNMRAMQQRGMSPMAVLQAATRNVAAAYQMLDDLGTLEAGKYADVLVLTADPLLDLENLRRISHVFKGGLRVEREALPEQPILTSEEARNPGEIREI